MAAAACRGQAVSGRRVHGASCPRRLIGWSAMRSVSEATRPIEPAADGQGLLSVAQRQGMSSSMRSLGQPLTRRVSTSVK